MRYTKFNLPEGAWGGDEYYIITDDGKSMCEIVLNNANTVESIVNGINKYMRKENWQEGDWDWARTLLYLKVNIDTTNKKTYVYLIQ